MRKWRHLVAPCLVGLGFALPARAGDVPLDLTWTVPENCPARGTVLKRVNEIVGHSTNGAPRVEARASIARDKGAFELTLETRIADTKDRRVLRAPTCSALAEASAVVLALAIRTLENSDGGRDGGDSAVSPPVDASSFGTPPSTVPGTSALPPTQPPASIAAAPAETRPASEPSGRGVHGVVGTGFAANAGTLPSIALGFVVAGTLRLDAWRVELELTTWFEQHPTFGDTGSVGASFRAAEGQVAGCRVFLQGRIGAGPCIGMRATATEVEGFGIRRPSSSQAFWASATLGGRGEWQIFRRVGLAVRADLVVPLAPPIFIMGSAQTGTRLHDPAPLAGQILAVTEIALF